MDDLGIDTEGFEEPAAHEGEGAPVQTTAAWKVEGPAAVVGSSAVGLVNAAGSADVAQSCLGGVLAGGDIEMSRSFSCDVVAKGDVSVDQGGTLLTVAGGNVGIDRGLGLVTVSRTAELSHSNVGFLVSGRTSLSEDSKVMMDAKAAAVFGAVFGGVMIVAFGALFGWGWWALKRYRPHLEMPHFDMSHIDMPRLTWRERA